MEIIKKNIRVIGDVHGNSKDFEDFTRDAIQNDMHVVCLGDFTDRGPDSPGVLQRAFMMMETGNFTPIVGNHDDKFWRWANGNNITINNGLEKTINQLDDHPDGDALIDQWRNQMPTWPVWVTHGKFTFAHGAFHPVMMQVKTLAHMDKKQHGSAASRAFFGQVHKGQKTPEGFPVRRLDWVDEIPHGHTVFVGHSVLSETEIITMDGKQGGKAVFVDTGSGKGGPLSFVDIEVE